MNPAIVTLFVEAAASTTTAPVPVTPGWTPSAFMGLLTNIIGLAVGGGGLKIFASHLLAMRKIADARANTVDARGDAQNIALAARVSDLETQATSREKAWADERREFDKALSDERRDCDKQLAEMRGELREMQTKVDGFVRQMIAFQTSEARAMGLSPQMARAVESVERIQESKE